MKLTPEQQHRLDLLCLNHRDEHPDDLLLEVLTPRQRMWWTARQLIALVILFASLVITYILATA